MVDSVSRRTGRTKRIPLGKSGQVSPEGEPHSDAVGRQVWDVIERLARMSRAAGTPDERQAADALSSELQSRGARVRVEPEQVHGTYWVPIGIACAGACCAALRGRVLGVLAGVLAAASVADDLEIGFRPLRKLLRQRIAYNVVAEAGSDTAPTTVVVHAHHDAAHSGLVFHPTIAKLTARLAGGLVERVGGTPAPMWGAVAGPAAVAAGALLRRSRLKALGALMSAGYAVAMSDIARRAPVPGANDNLSGVAVLLILAEQLAVEPTPSLRVLLLSTGSEESFLEAMVRFGERHFRSLARESTTFLCIESVGSPHLMLLSGEGLLRLHRYPDSLIGLISRLAARERLHLRAPFRYRLATDGQIPLRAGYGTAAISSMDWYKAPSNYHWPSDSPENLDRDSVAAAAALAEAFVRHLDRKVSAHAG